VGLDTQATLAAANWQFVQSLVTFLALAALALAVTRQMAQSWLIHPMQRLMGATDRLSRGDPAARVGDVGGTSEVAELAHAFDVMAERVTARTRELSMEIHERERVEAQIRQQHALLENTLESLTHPFYVVNVADYTIQVANSAALG
jgi:nitrate/nitrite-specific signal transduction histidine kinase